MINNQFIAVRLKRIKKVLAKNLPSVALRPVSLHKAMRYSVLSGGKRIRPLLVYAVGEGFGASLTSLDAAACAVELIHCYSLIHDDLPAMDNDDFRRGKPTCHKAFGEAVAILAGDALANLASSILTNNKLLSFEKRIRMANILAKASSSNGMAGGQALELETICHTPTNNIFTIKQLEHIHSLKTGALISAAVNLGALASKSVTKEQFAFLGKYAKNLGLAFQIQDDINDNRQDFASGHNQINYVSLLGLDGAKKKLAHFQHKAWRCLEQLENNSRQLKIVTSYIIKWS
jgi:farnesyl diphosphate synthase